MKMSRTSGFTLVELMIVVLVMGVLAALGTPFLIQAKAASNEASAIGSLRAINSSETNYSVSCGGGAYAVNLPVLVAGRYLSPDMGFNPKSGYNFNLQAGAGAQAGPADCAGAATQTAYYATGRPLSAQTGRRGFATNADSAIWQDTTGVPPAEPFASGPTISTIE